MAQGSFQTGRTGQACSISILQYSTAVNRPGVEKSFIWLLKMIPVALDTTNEPK